MGGREIGGLANTLAAHMDYDTPGAMLRVSDFWHSEQMAKGPGHKAVELFEAVHRGEIRVLWVMGTNPAVSLDRKSTRLNSSHVRISYAVFCLKKKKTKARRSL